MTTMAQLPTAANGQPERRKPDRRSLVYGTLAAAAITVGALLMLKYNGYTKPQATTQRVCCEEGYKEERVRSGNSYTIRCAKPEPEPIRRDPPPVTKHVPKAPAKVPPKAEVAVHKQDAAPAPEPVPEPQVDMCTESNASALGGNELDTYARFTSAINRGANTLQGKLISPPRVKFLICPQPGNTATAKAIKVYDAGEFEDDVRGAANRALAGVSVSGVTLTQPRKYTFRVDLGQ